MLVRNEKKLAILSLLVSKLSFVGISKVWKFLLFCLDEREREGINQGKRPRIGRSLEKVKGVSSSPYQYLVDSCR
jgi:hypothetical protein